jgi:hypothetical protein
VGCADLVDALLVDPLELGVDLGLCELLRNEKASQIDVPLPKHKERGRTM